MAIQWKKNIGESNHASGVTYTLCGADEDMSTIKSVNIVNGNPQGSGAAVVDVWIDTSQQDNSSPEYSVNPIYLIKNKQLSPQRVIVLGTVISNATPGKMLIQ